MNDDGEEALEVRLEGLNVNLSVGGVRNHPRPSLNRTNEGQATLGVPPFAFCEWASVEDSLVKGCEVDRLNDLWEGVLSNLVPYRSSQHNVYSYI